MKKIVLIIVVIILVAGGGFYYFFMMGDQNRPVASSSEPSTSAVPAIADADNAYINYQRMEMMFPGTKVKKEEAKLQIPSSPEYMKLMDLKYKPSAQDIPVLKQMVEQYKPALDEMEQGAQKSGCVLPLQPLPKGNLTMDAVTTTMANASLPNLLVYQTVAKLMIRRGNLAELENHPQDAIKEYVNVIKVGKQLDQTYMLPRLIGIALRAMGSNALTNMLYSPGSIPSGAMILEQLKGLGTPPKLELNTLADYEPALRGNDIPDMPKVNIDIMMSNFAETSTRYNIAFAKQELALVCAAIRTYQSKNNKLPEKPEELNDVLSGYTPKDPFSGQAYKFSKNGNELAVYSFGPDKVDDSGQKEYDASNRNDKGGDIIARIQMQ